MSNFLIDEDTDLLAAEFVLGTLDSEERANAQTLLRTDRLNVFTHKLHQIVARGKKRGATPAQG